MAFNTSDLVDYVHNTKHLCRSILINKNFINFINFFKKETPTQVFAVNLAKFFRTPFFYRTDPVAGCFWCLIELQYKVL